MNPTHPVPAHTGPSRSRPKYQKRRGWYLFLHRLCLWLYFNRVTVIHPERIPVGGPVLYLGIHRNGAVDGLVYHAVLPHITLMISTQLRRTWMGRLFFSGIEVVRAKDRGDSRENTDAMKQCVELLKSGGNLFVFPEGTSTLGPRHLPFKSGASRILLEYLRESGPPVQVVPVAVSYERPWAFRSNVEVVVGRPIPTAMEKSTGPADPLNEMKTRIQTALEAIGVNVESDEYQAMIQRLGVVSAMETRGTFHQTLKAFERSIPEGAAQAWERLEQKLNKRGVLQYQGVPLFPPGRLWPDFAAVCLLGPLVLGGILLNLVPILGGAWAGRKLADDRNVISLWRIMVGVPLLAVWICAGGVLAFGIGKIPWLGAYILISLGGLISYGPFKKRGVSVYNQLRFPKLRTPALAFRAAALQASRNEKH